MTDKIKYLLNHNDSALPTYEVNYTKKTWKVVSFRRTAYGDEFISGKLRKPTDFNNYNFKEVPKPKAVFGMRLLK